MATDGKPYRVYRGGRSRGRVPLQRPTQPGQSGPGGDPGRAVSGGQDPGRPMRSRGSRRRWILLGVALAVVLLVAWGALSVLAVSRGIGKANDRVAAGLRSQLVDDTGLLVSKPSTLLVLGTDGGAIRPGAARSDSIMLVRTDPSHKRLYYLSIPRDLQVSIPGYGVAKINAASQIGGPPLTLRTVRDLTGLPVNHVVTVDFDRFREVIDAVGGIDLVVPRRIRSKRFDCPYATAAKCAKWPGWRFAKGPQHMDGRRALVYSRIRVNELDPSETDFDRARRQQQVVQATLAKATGLGTALRLPFVGDDLVKPLATDLSTWQLLELGWVSMRADAGSAIHCRLGGDPASVSGESVILPSEDNVGTVAMFTGQSAPLAPPKGLPYAPGCRIGDAQ